MSSIARLTIPVSAAALIWQVPTTPENKPIFPGVSYVFISAVYSSSFPGSSPGASSNSDWTVVEANICAGDLFLHSHYVSANPLLWWV